MRPKLYDRQQLLDDVWSNPVRHLADGYGLSDAGLKKLCIRLQIPTPPRGYWAKLSSGKKVPPKPRLSEYTGAYRHLVIPMRGDTGPAAEDRDTRLVSVIIYETDPANKIVVPARMRDPHPLARLTQVAALDAPLDQREQPAVCGRSIHLRVSKIMQARALRIADALLKALEKRGYEIQLGDDGAAVLFHGLKYRFEFYESCSRVEYQKTEADKHRRQDRRYLYTPPWVFVPSGVLILQTHGGYGPKVMDGKRNRVEDMLNSFLVRVATDGVRSLTRQEAFELKEAEFALNYHAWKRSKEKQDDEREKLEALEQEALKWQRAQRLREYLRAMSNAYGSSDNQSDEQRALIEWGNAKANWLDPLTARPDKILDEQLEEPRRGFP